MLKLSNLYANDGRLRRKRRTVTTAVPKVTLYMLTVVTAMTTRNALVAVVVTA